ncbi:MAG TPA: gluconeogenesis factor YvcK family protein, partial [Gammaproteobacteria bacterium]|nr:gluconeogenesis factor YvcK family protein [Gammaproteobacteria bacterium]
VCAVVNMADDGGSSGGLRRDFHIPALGDLRNCLLATAEGDPTLQALFDFRFKTGVDGHSLGNLMLAALLFLERDLAKAVARANVLLLAHARVLPATTANVELLAEFADGHMVRGETRIVAEGRPIRKLSLLPGDAEPTAEVLAALAASDLIVLGPGSLYTSVIPNLLLKGMAAAIARSGALVALVMNLMTEPGETRGYRGRDVIAALRQHAPALPIHAVVVNDAPLPPGLRERYAARGSVPIAVEPVLLEGMGYRCRSLPLLAQGVKIRHDPVKLAESLLVLAGAARADSGARALLGARREFASPPSPLAVRAGRSVGP